MFKKIFGQKNTRSSGVGTTCGIGSVAGRDKILFQLIRDYEFYRVLDLGCGAGDFFYFLNNKDIEYKGVGIDLMPEEKVKTDLFDYRKIGILEYETDEKFDLIFSSHVIEHFQDTGIFLNRFFSFLKPDGIFCLIWPPPKPNVVGGHLHIFNMGLMLYNIIRAGVDCSAVKMYESGYNLAIMGRYKPVVLQDLTYNRFELDSLSEYFPVEMKHGMHGRLKKHVKSL